jgi:anaerobic selenocysteine-containing dehydrogenase
MSGVPAVRPPTSVPSKILASVCPLDCPDACSLEVHVEGDRVVAVGGSRINPVTEGYICAKVRRLPEHVHGERRVRYPAVREGRKGEGRFRRVSWDEALDTIAARMTELVRRGDSERILPFYYGGSNGYISQNTSDLRLFTRLGASRLARPVCAAPSGAAVAGLYGTMPGIALQDYGHSRLIVLWASTLPSPAFTSCRTSSRHRGGARASSSSTRAGRALPSGPTSISRRSRERISPSRSR